MSFFPASLENLIDKFASLPGIGRKSAQRLAFHVLSLPEAEAYSFADAITDARRNVHTCRVCQNLTEGELCSICASDRRDHSTICVVSEPRDVLSIERGHEYNGSYHVLHGALSPMSHVGCASASAAVTRESSSRERPKKGPPEQVSQIL